MARVKYRTIVVDPPWQYKGTLPGFKKDRRARSAVPYATMTLEQIAALRVRDLAENDAHLYLWTTNTHLPHVWPIVQAWGFAYSTLLLWLKAPRGSAGFPTYQTCSEYLLFCRRGSLKATERMDRNWWTAPRQAHSAKPELFLDLIERVSPPPRIELFARRNRLGWDTWGDEALNHVELTP